MDMETRIGGTMTTVDSALNQDQQSLYMEAINSGLGNPFRCEVCNEEYDDLAYEG